MSQKVLDRVLSKFPDFVLSTHDQCGDETLVLRREGLLPIATFLKEDPDMDFSMCTDVTGIDMMTYPGYEGPRLIAVYHLYSVRKKHRVCIKVPLELSDPVVESVSSLWAGANFFERETWDMLGIRFDHSPDHRRVLLYEEFEGHPLRKDYPQRGYQPLMPMPALQRLDKELPPVVDEDL